MCTSPVIAFRQRAEGRSMDRSLVQAKQSRSYAGSNGKVDARTESMVVRVLRTGHVPSPSQRDSADLVCVLGLSICPRGNHAAADVMRNRRRRLPLVHRAATTKPIRRSFNR
jgi:hypothetical protein